MTQRQTNPEEFDTGHLLLWTVRVGILAVMAMPLIISNDTIFPFIVGKAIYARSVIEVTFGIWLLLIFFYPRYRPSRSLILIALAVWLLISLIAAFTGVSLTRSLWSNYERMQGVVDLAHWFVFIAMTGSVFRNMADWRILFTVNLIICMVVSLLGINQHYDVFDLAVFEILRADRIESTLGNATYVGAYTMVNALVGISMIIHSLGSQTPDTNPEHTRPAPQSRAARRRRRGAERSPSPASASFSYLPWLQSVWVLSVMLSLWALWLTGTRGAVVGLGTAALLFSVGYLIWGRIRIARFASLALIVAAIAVIAMFALVQTTNTLDPIVESNTMLSRISTIGLEDASISGRVSGAQAGLLAYLEKPVLGWGPENFLIAWGKHVDPEAAKTTSFDQAHNKLVEELTTKGTLGFLSYMLVWAAMAWAMLISIRRRRGSSQLAVLILAAAMLAYFVQNLFLFDTPVTLMQFSMLAAFAVAQEYWAAQQDRTQPETRRRAVSNRLSLRPVSAILRTSWGAVILMALVAVVIVGALYALNLRAYASATSAPRVGHPNSSWDASVASLNDTVAAFPALANYPRRDFIISSMGRLQSPLPDDQFYDTLEIAENTGEEALSIEPYNPSILMAMTAIYQLAGERDPDSEYLTQAEEYLDRTTAAAPNMPELHRLIERQDILENMLTPPAGDSAP